MTDHRTSHVRLEPQEDDRRGDLLTVGTSPGDRRSRSRRSRRVEPPGGAADPRATRSRQHRPLRVRQPRQPDTVTLIANWIPFEEPSGGPNFYPFATDAAYNIKIDNNGDAQGRRHLPLDVQGPLPEQRTVPVQHRRR